MARLAGEIVSNISKCWNAFYLPSLRDDRNTKGKGGTVRLQSCDRVLVDESKGNAFIDTWVPGVVVKAVPSADGCVQSAIPRLRIPLGCYQTLHGPRSTTVE
jgi:hypothetical protein